MAMDVVDYRLHGDDMQFVEIELDPGEAAIGEAGSMMCMEDGIRMDTGCVVAYTPGVDFDIQFVGGVKTALFGGDRN